MRLCGFSNDAENRTDYGNKRRLSAKRCFPLLLSGLRKNDLFYLSTAIKLQSEIPRVNHSKDNVPDFRIFHNIYKKTVEFL